MSYAMNLRNATMLKASLLGRTGQLWKLIVAVGALLIGSFAPLYPALAISWTVGTVIAIAGYVFGIIVIRCASCGNRWLWGATKGDFGYSVLFNQAKCPGCQHDFA
jgi:protein-S-isoprenylcysteine O-methyltransferase Ste14